MEGDEVDELLADVESVPAFLFYVKGKRAAIVQGADATAVSTTLEKLIKEMPASEGGVSPAMKARLEGLVSSAPVMVFMKGNPENLRCKFSRALVDILKGTELEYGSFDIRDDNNQDVRQALKDFSGHRTYPQVWVKSKLIGGLDDIKSLLEKAGGDPKALGNAILEAEAKRAAAVPAASATSKEDLDARLGKLIKSSKVMLFMKGQPSDPKCGFSSKIVALLASSDIDYASFDILSDEAVRQGLKKYSNWPTYPQLYVDGTLIGGLDIVQEMAEEGDLKEELGL